MQAMRKFYETDELGTVLPVPAGSARIEPGLPEEAVVLNFPTWTSFVDVRFYTAFWVARCRSAARVAY